MQMVTVSLQHELDMISMLVSRARLVQNTVNGCGDFIAQFILVLIAIVPSIIRFNYLNLHRSTDVGSCGVKVSVS